MNEKMRIALEAISAGHDNEHKFGCIDSSCEISRPTGMMTNAGCRCNTLTFRRALRWMKKTAREALKE